MTFTLALAAIALYYAWRYSKTEIDPDWSMFNLWSFTGAVYGRDFVDCKMPTIHLWYLALGKILGRNIPRIKFVHHLLISLPGVVVGGWEGLAYIVVVNSGVLMAFHGNVGQPAAAALFLAIWLDQPIASSLLALLAVAFEPKLVVSSCLLSLVSGWGMPFLLGAALAGAGALSLKWLWPEAWGYLWEANITLPRRMTMVRRQMLKAKDLKLYPWYTAQGAVYIAPWLAIGAVYNQDVTYWLPVLAYVVLIAVGIVVRPNHLIVLAPWAAWAGIPPAIIVALVAADWIGAGFYLGDIWDRFYQGLHDANMDAREVGEFLKDKPGRLWVNAYHSGMYVISGKPPIYGFVEQIEIRESSPERRDYWRKKFKGNAPEWVVQGPGPGWKFNPSGYDLVAESRGSQVFRKMTTQW